MSDLAAFNTAVKASRDRAEEHYAALEAAYARLLRAAGRVAAETFVQSTRNLTAATHPWEPPQTDLVDGDQLAQDAQAALAPAHKRILRAVAVAGDIGVAFDIRHPTTQALLAAVAQRLGTLGAAIREQVAEMIQQGYDEGWSVQKTAAAIVAKVDAVTPGRAAALARTDLNSLANGGSLMAAQQVDGVNSKTWLATNDEATRETHAEADGQTVPIDQPFDVGGELAQFPGDPDLSDAEAFNCRCTLVYGEDLTAAADHNEGGDMEPTLDDLSADELRDLAARATTLATQRDRETLILTDFVLTAAADGGPTAWQATLLVEGEATEDGRLMLPGSISWRQLPLTLGLMLETAHTDMAAAPTCGRIDMIWRAGNAVQAAGVFTDTSDDPALAEAGRAAVAAVSSRTVRGISVDLAVLDWEEIFEPKDTAGNADEEELPLEDVYTESGEQLDIPVIIIEEPEGRWLYAVKEGVIGSACIVPFAAIANATIEVVTATGALRIVRSTWPLFADCGCDGLTAAVAPLKPPAAWFTDPHLSRPTPLTVTDDGRVYGHVALWGTCHTGYPGRCVTPPKSRSGYAHFHVGELELDDGARLAVGKITLAGPHAGTVGVSAAAARAHYDNTASVASFVRAGDDGYGIWVAGALKSDLAPERVRDLMANPISGDWRNNEMIAAHAVPVPGFPVLRAAGYGDDGEEGETALIIESPLVPGEEPPPVSPLDYLRPGRVKAAA